MPSRQRVALALVTLAGVAALALVGGAVAGPATSPPGYGTQMIEVGYRFAMAGRAAESQNFQLAAYQLEELAEAFVRVSSAPLPRDLPRGAHLGRLLDTFAYDSLASMRKAAEAKDLRAFRNAYATAVTQCNGCHRAAGRAFLRVPAIPQGTTFVELKP